MLLATSYNACSISIAESRTIISFESGSHRKVMKYIPSCRCLRTTYKTDAIKYKFNIILRALLKKSCYDMH